MLPLLRRVRGSACQGSLAALCQGDANAVTVSAFHRNYAAGPPRPYLQTEDDEDNDDGEDVCVSV
jgi:hypothetical protein